MARKLVVEIVGDTSSLQRAFRQVDRQSKSFSTRISRSLKVGLFAGAAAGATGLAIAFKAGFDEIAESQKVLAQTTAALKSTGGAANVTADQISNLATSLSQMSGADDEAVQSAENLLLTFTRIRNEAGKGNDIFNQSTKAVLDLSTALGQDLNTSAIQVGKALNDPIKGLGALRRVGVSFSADQQTLVRRLVETGHTMDAQKVILHELTREFGGSAKAFGQTLPGQLSKLRNNLDETAARFVQVLAPSIQKALDKANRWLANEKNQKQITDDLNTSIRFLAGGFELLAATIKEASAAYKGFRGLGADLPGGKEGFFSRLITGTLPEQVGDLSKRIHHLADELGLVHDKARQAASGLSFLRGPVGTPARPASAAGAFEAPGLAGPIGRAPTALTAQQRNQFFDARITRALDRVQDIPTLRGQIARLREIAGIIEDRMAATKDITRRLTLEDRLLDVQREIRSDIAAKNQKAADEALAAAEKLKRQEQKQQRAEKAATDAASRRIAARNKAALANARAINEFSKKTQKLAQKEAELFRHVDPNKLARMLGLPGDRAAAAVLATIGRGGTAPARTSAAFAGQTTVINIANFHSSANNPRELEAELAKRARGRAHTRRGAR